MAITNLFGALALDTTVAAVRDFLASLVGVRDAAAAADQKGVAALVVRGDSDTITTADGDLSMIRVDEEGRVKVASKTASFPATQGWVNTVGSTVAVDVSRASNVVWHVKNVGTVTLAAGTFVFEASVDSTNGVDGTWFSIQAVRTNANTIETSIALSGIAAGNGYAAAWEASVNAYKWLRIRCTLNVTTNASAMWTILRGSYATEPIPAAQVTSTQSVTGSVIANTATGSSYYVETTAAVLAAVLRAGGASLLEVTVTNPTASAIYVKFYNKTTAPNVGADTPFVTIPVAANSMANIAFGTTGKRFATGCAIGATGAMAKTDSTVPPAGVQISATYV